MRGPVSCDHGIGAPAAGQAAPAHDLLIRDDLKNDQPVTAAELDVIEAFLGAVLQDILKNTDSKAPQKPVINNAAASIGDHLT